MGFFNGLKEEINLLNKDVNNVANCEKAKNLRKKLLSIGLPLAIIGFVGVFACFIWFTVGGMSSVSSHTFSSGFDTGILVPFFLIIPCALMGSIGSIIASYGFKIVVVGYTTKLIDDTVGNNCPQCGDAIEPEEMFCSNCGFRLKKQCQNCQYINTHKDRFCKKCGREL